MEKPNRFMAFLAYLLLLIGPLIIILFRRKDHFSLYHACQSLAIVAAALVVPVVWLTLGWFVTWFSVTAPILYLVPLAIGLLVPVYQNRRNAARYTRESGDWTGLTISILVAGALIYGSYLVLNFLAPIVLPLVGQLLLMSGFAVVMAAFMVLAVGWIAGMVHALRAQEKAVPVFGGWGDRFFAWLT